MTLCPRCGASNPSENKFCGNCGQQLLPAAPDHQEEQLPAWLRESMQEPAPAAPPPAASGAQAEALPAWLTNVGVEDEPERGVETTAPDWLADLQQAAPTADRNALPAWLAEEEATPPPPSAPASDLPDWLRELESSPPESSPVQSDAAAWTPRMSDAAPQTPAVPAPDDLPDWLREFDTPTSSGEPAAPSPVTASVPVADHPAWLVDEAGARSPEPASAVQPLAAADELPPWLRDDESPSLSSAQAAERPVEPPASDLPGWLSQAEPATFAPPAPVPSTDLPAWLHEDAARDAQAEETTLPVPDWGAEFGPEPSAAASPTEQLPSWLNEADDSTSFTATAATVPSQTSDLPAWLIEASPTAAPPADEPPTIRADVAAPAGELPAWLMDETVESSSAQPVAQPVTDLPSWLAADTTPATETALADTTETLPSWLAKSSSVEASSAEPATTQALPAWLLDADQPATPQTPAAPSAQDELPPWLQETDEPAPSPAGSELPPWFALPDEAAPTSAAAQPLPTSEVEVPPWLAAPHEAEPATHIARTYDSASDMPVAEPHAAKMYDAPAGQPTQPADNSAGTVELPAWLAADEPANATSGNSAATTALPAWLADMPDETPAQAEASTGLPSWLEEPESQAALASTPAAPDSGLLGGLDLPAWLRDEKEAAPAAPAAEVAPAWLQRMAPEPEEATPTPTGVEAPPTPRIARTPERIAAAQLLDRLVAEPAAEPASQPVTRRRAWPIILLAAIAALLLVGTILYLLLNNRLPLNFGAAPAKPLAGAQVAQMIQALPANRPVVLAYEWNAQRLGDLQPLEEGIVSTLARRTDVPLLFVSTDPQGALLATDRASRLLATNDNFHNRYGLGLVNLGFKAGGAVALRRFGSNQGFGDLLQQDAYGNNLRGSDVTLQSVCGAATADRCSWDNVGLLVLMTDDVEDVRTWFEQVRSEHPTLQTLVLTPAELAPQVQPYAVLPRVQMLSGVQAAFAYAQANGMQTERLGRQMDATTIGGALFAVLVALGAVPAYIVGRRARAESKPWER